MIVSRYKPSYIITATVLNSAAHLVRRRATETCALISSEKRDKTSRHCIPWLRWASARLGASHCVLTAVLTLDVKMSGYNTIDMSASDSRTYVEVLDSPENHQLVPHGVTGFVCVFCVFFF